MVNVIRSIQEMKSLTKKIRPFFSMGREKTRANDELAAKSGPRLFFKNMQNFFFSGWLVSEFFKNSIVLWLLFGSIFLNAANWIFLAIFIRPVDYNIILHYNVYFGVDLIGNWWQPYVLPVMGIIFLLVNLLLARRLFRQKERIAAYILLLSALIIQVGLIIASAGVVLINY